MSSSGLLSTGETDILERVQCRATKVIKGLEHFFYKEKAERAGTVQSGEEKAQGDLINVGRE